MSVESDCDAYDGLFERRYHSRRKGPTYLITSIIIVHLNVRRRITGMLPRTENQTFKIMKKGKYHEQCVVLGGQSSRS